MVLLQPSTMGNSPQLSKVDELSVTYQHGTLQTDISNLQTSEVESLEINWSDTFSQKEHINIFFPQKKHTVVGRKF